jgi:hypothetical protein
LRRDRSARQDQHVKANDPSKLRGLHQSLHTSISSIVAWIGNSRYQH